jgi:hypothetical protein
MVAEILFRLTRVYQVVKRSYEKIYGADSSSESSLLKKNISSFENIIPLKNP